MHIYTHVVESVDVGALVDQQLGGFHLVGEAGDVQRRVALLWPTKSDVI